MAETMANPTPNPVPANERLHQPRNGVEVPAEPLQQDRGSAKAAAQPIAARARTLINGG
jgi:hypothetical protein